MSAGPTQGRPCERGEAQARSARPRAWAAADSMARRVARLRKEAANGAPCGGSAAELANEAPKVMAN